LSGINIYVKYEADNTLMTVDFFDFKIFDLISDIQITLRHFKRQFCKKPIEIIY